MNKLLNRPLRFAIYFALGLIVLCFLWVFFLTKPAFIPSFNLQGKYQIGETIGGMTAPLVGIGSSVLLFLALVAQMRATEMQRKAFTGQDQKNESDFIFTMFNQFLTELSFFTYSFFEVRNHLDVKSEHTGLDALNKFVNRYITTSLKEQSIGTYPQSRQILLLLDSLSSIKQRIENADITEGNRTMYFHKLNSYYENFFQVNLESLIRTFHKFPKSADEKAYKMKLFFYVWQPKEKSTPEGPA